MKRINNLYNRICNLENIHLAELKTRKGKLKKDYVIEFKKNRTEKILEIYKELKEETYRSSGFSHFVIYEPKKRRLSRPTYKDRIVQHSIMTILEPIFKDCFISQTYSSLKGRGIHKCSSDLKNGLIDIENTTYCLKLDIKKFYESVDNKILIELLKTKFKDEKLLRLLTLIINSHKGLPLGSFTSQYFAHFYTNKMNHWLKEIKKVKHLYIYCDDYVILGNSKEDLHKLRVEIEEYLKINLKLELSNWQIFPIYKRSIDFVGYVINHDYRRLRKSIKQQMKKMIRYYPNTESKASYRGWTKWANCRNLENKYLNGRKETSRKL